MQEKLSYRMGTDGHHAIYNEGDVKLADVYRFDLGAVLAAAPDLLLTLETIEAATSGLSHALAQEINRSARKAIAKATGR